jgi:prepilin-type N-terminal cleavage/methylation domain-containing protein
VKLAREHGYTVVELLVVMLILGVVMGSLTTVFVQASNAELDLNQRFQAQQNARLALDKLRRETHCASQATVSTPSSVTLTLASYCPTGSGSVTWCVASVGGAADRYGLYRKAGTSCDSGGVKWADYLTSSNAFSYTAQSSDSLAKLHVDFPVNLKPSKSVRAYELVDDITLRNSLRSSP